MSKVFFYLYINIIKIYLLFQVSQYKNENLVPSEMCRGVSLDSLAAVLYTSGSTGVPKGVRIPQKAVLNRLSWQWSTFPYSENEVCFVI